MHVVAVLLLALGSVPGHSAETYLLVASGLGGDESHVQQFHDWALRLLAAAAAAGIPPQHVTYLAEDPERDADRISGRSTKEVVLGALGELAERAGEQDLVWIVLIGHGSAADGTARLNLPGPDMTADDFATALAQFASRVAFVNTASASGAFLPALAGPGRAVVTATKSAGQRNETIFAGPFISALEDRAADLDKNGRVSLLEAFEYARQEVAKHYADESLLATENALLEDNGDGEGTLQPPLLATGGAAEDGIVASRMYFGSATAAPAGASSELAALLGEKEVLERRIEELRLQKGALPEELYLGELEALLLELARKDEAIRERLPGAAGAGESDGGEESAGETPISPAEGPADSGEGGRP